MQQLNKVVEGVANPMYNLSARSKALSAAVGSADSSLKAHAKSVGQLARNNSVLTNELGRVRKEIAGMGKEYKFATDASGSFRKAAISDLKAYEGALKGIRLRALTEDLKGVAQEQKRLGKDAQFVGRSLIIGLTTPIMGFARYGLQALVSLDQEFVRLNKVLEGVAPNLDAAAKKMAIDLTGATKEQSKQLQGMVDKYNALDKSLGKVSNRFGLAKSLTVGLAGDFAELGIQSEESIVKITELAAVTEKLGDMDIGAAKDLVQSLYFQAQRAMQMSGQGRNMTFEEREIAAIGAATAQLNLFNSVENVTALTLRDLGDAFPEVAAAGSSFGLSMTELASMLAPMKAAGFEVGASANSIKVSLQRLVAPTKQNAELFKQLSKEYNTNFTTIKGTGLDAIQELINGFNELKGTAAGQEGAMEFFAKVFGVRQGPRMEVALAQMADFDEVLKSNTVSMDSAEKKLQSYANQAVTAANVTRDVNLPLIKSYKDIGIIARIATTQMKEGETRMIDGFGRVTMEQVKAAREVRQAVTDEIVKAQRTDGEDLIGQVNTEAGRAMFIQLAGAANAAEVAQRELDVALGSLNTQISILKNNFKAFATDLIQNVRPAIEKLTDISNKLITAWSNLDERTKKLFSTVTLLIAGATAAIGPMIFVFGQFRLAMGSVAKVLFSFLPGLKTMSVEAVAGASAMLRLTKPLTVVGDTVVNTNNKFATFIATLASGDGPVSRLANKIGLMTGALQKQNTASMVLTRSVNRQKAAKIELAAVEGAGAILGSPPAGPTTGFKALSYAPLSGLGAPGALTGPAPGPLGVTARNLVARFGSDKPLRGATGPAGSADSVKNFNRAVREETFRLLEEAGFTKKNIGDMLRTPTSLTRTIVGPASDQARQNVQDAMGEIAAVTKGQRRFDRGAGLRQRFLDREQASILAGKSEAEAKKILNAQQVARQEAKGITTQLGGRGTGSLIKERFFKGVKIDDDTFDTVMGGGIRGRLASTKLNLGIAKTKLPDLVDRGAGKFLGGKQTVAAVKGVATFGKDLFTQPSKALGDFVGLFKSGFSSITGVFGKIGPMFLKIGSFIKNPMLLFVKFKAIIVGLGPAIMAAVSSFGAITGIGLIIGAIVAIVIVLVKNWDAFVAAIQPGIEALKDTFDILKDAVMGLVQPFLDFFNSIGGEGEGSNAIIATLATTFNILADVIKVLAIALKFVFVEIFGRIIKVALSSLLALLKGIGNFVMGLWKVIKGIFTFNWSSIVDGFKKMGKGIAQVAIGLMGPFADFFVFVLKGVKMIFDQLAKLPGWLGGGVFKKASQGIGAAISFVEDTRNLKKGKGKGGKDTPEVDTDPMQEQIANASGDGLKEGADEGAKELAKRAKQALKDLKKEVQEEIASRIKDAMNDVVDNIKEALKNQKAAALGIYDAQIKKIEDVGKAEERLTKEQEYQNKLREAEDQRALNRLNTRRSYAMAVYAGQIDEARSIADEGARQEAEDNKKVEEINKGRAEELAEQNRKDMID
jgi:TP901 family phage tail tape measure protein